MYQSLTNTYRDIYREENGQEETDVEVLLEQIQQLDEISLSRALRSVSAIVFARNSKKNGDNVVRIANKGKSILKRFKPNMSVDEKLDVLNDGLEEMFNLHIQTRNQIGNLVGVALTSALISERSRKELEKMMRKSRR
tara:strand:- start:81 stop:494 length:414 start_codon:yes stop_codon:yes gene_type:complete